MYFVYTNWYIVMAILVVAIIGLIVTFILMDKKDKALIQEFVENSQSQVVTEKENDNAEESIEMTETKKNTRKVKKEDK